MADTHGVNNKDGKVLGSSRHFLNDGRHLDVSDKKVEADKQGLYGERDYGTQRRKAERISSAREEAGRAGWDE